MRPYSKYLSLTILIISLVACGGNKKKVVNDMVETKTDSIRIIPNPAFLAFVEQFPVLEKLNVTKEQIETDWNHQYVQIAPDSVLKYIYHIDLSKKDSLIRHLKDEALDLPSTKSSEGPHYAEIGKIATGTIKYYAVGQLNLSDQFKSIVILYKNISPDAMPVGHRYSLINYKLDGSLISLTDIAYGEKYMSYRIHECTLEKDLLKITELDYYEGANIGETCDFKDSSNYTTYEYFRLQEDGTFKNVQNEFYPYSNLSFVNKAGDKYQFSQDNIAFFILFYPVGASSSEGWRNIKARSTKEKLWFSKSDGVEFSVDMKADFSAITVTEANKAPEVYLKKEETK